MSLTCKVVAGVVVPIPNLPEVSNRADSLTVPFLVNAITPLPLLNFESMRKVPFECLIMVFVLAVVVSLSTIDGWLDASKTNNSVGFVVPIPTLPPAGLKAIFLATLFEALPCR